MINKSIYKKAAEVGYKVSKGFRHYLYNGSVVSDESGNRKTGYEVTDMSTGLCVWGSYNETFDHLWSLKDVENFIRSVYESNGLIY